MDSDVPLLKANTVTQVRQLGGEELLRRLVGLLLELTPQRLSVFREALRSGDLEAARKAAHALSSTAGVVGAAELLEAARRIEQAPSAAEVRTAGETLEIEWRRLEEPLARWLEGAGSPR